MANGNLSAEGSASLLTFMNVEIIQGGGLPEMGGFIAQALSSMHPQDAQAMLGAIFVNMVGNIPDDHWEAIKKAAQLPCECGDAGCGEAARAMIKAGEVAREQFKRVTGKRNPENLEEKGFSE